MPSATEDRGGEAKTAREKLFRALDVANFTIHSIDPTGLETLAPGADRVSAGRISPDRIGQISSNLASQGDLRTLPAQTGGRAVMNANDPGQYLPAIFNESRLYYSLGFLPRRPSSRWAVPRHRRAREPQGCVRVCAEGLLRSWWRHTEALPLDTPGAPAVLADTVTASWPKPDLPMRVSVSAFATLGEARPIASVVVGAMRSATAINEARKASPANGAVRNGQLDVLVAAFDRDGQSANFVRQTLEITNATDAGLEYEVLCHRPLDPGRYEIRIATNDGQRNRPAACSRTWRYRTSGKLRSRSRPSYLT